MAWWDHDDLRDVRYKTNVEDNRERRMEKVSITKTAPEATSSANDRQVGGSHYQTGGVQHWDLFGPDYLIGYATKYMRWRKKGGVEDLEKAIHVIEKLKERRLRERAHPTYDRTTVAAWCDDAGLNWTERRIVHLIMFSYDDDALDEAIAGIRHLITSHVPPHPVGVSSIGDIIVQPQPKKSKSYSDMTNDELRDEMSRLERANAEATGWGAAVGARAEGISEIKDLLAARGQRTPEDGAQHAALAPWIVSATWFEDKKNITPELRSLFFREIVFGKIYHLEPCVISEKIPKQLAGVYRLLNNAWVLRMKDCPPDVRGSYPDLPRERNMMEHEETPTWQRAMYEWIETENKFALKPVFAAWHEETE